PLHNRFVIEGLEVWITHIGGYPGRYNPKLRNAIKARPPGLFICGHSHILKIMRDPKLNLLHMNPGAAGLHGFHKMRTMIRFEVNTGRILNPAVIELGPRSTSQDEIL
ncbi:MAG: metallophosphatase family protein, partial [Bacteroidota bacterium]|nr:metallophosphatase family protein [Bacteroidota bacterium]MDX5431301.1 metallophosphatase family protein [Bacteroidota bacterium]MDX5470039.1 metallophosphatase family protein [Bacteroidota bacterium]